MRAILVWALAVIVPLCFGGQKQYHYLFPAMPALAVLTGWVLEQTLQRGLPVRQWELGRMLLLATLFVLFGVDPLALTQISMALTAASLPIGVLPFLILMNDKHYLGEHTNGHLGNAVVLLISLMAMVLAVVSIPLELIGGGG